METFERGSVHPTAVVSSRAELGRDVTVGAFTVIHDGVRIGDRSVIGAHCAIGEPARGWYAGEESTSVTDIGADSVVRTHSTIYEGVTAGPGLVCGDHLLVRENCRIGEDVQLGANSELHQECVVGNHCRIQSDVGMAPGTVLEDFVWIFAWTLAVNDPHPPSDTCTGSPIVRSYAVVAAKSLLMPGIEVGEHAFVGAMTTVTRDVPPEAVVVGNPGKVVGTVRDITCKHGKLDQVYPWPVQFRRGFPEGALPPREDFL